MGRCLTPVSPTGAVRFPYGHWYVQTSTASCTPLLLGLPSLLQQDVKWGNLSVSMLASPCVVVIQIHSLEIIVAFWANKLVSSYSMQYWFPSPKKENSKVKYRLSLCAKRWALCALTAAVVLLGVTDGSWGFCHPHPNLDEIINRNSFLLI